MQKLNTHATSHATGSQIHNSEGAGLDTFYYFHPTPFQTRYDSPSKYLIQSIEKEKTVKSASLSLVYLRLNTEFPV